MVTGNAHGTLFYFAARLLQVDQATHRHTAPDLPELPIQHHYQPKGWPEVTIVVGFWIVCGILVASGLGLFYAERLTFS